MNTTTCPDNLAAVPRPTSDHRMPVPDSSMLRDAEKAAPAAQALDDGATARARRGR